MADQLDIGSSSEITNEACAWVAQLESGDLSSSDIAALREWMGRSPVHSREIREVAALSGQLSMLTEMAEPLAEAASIGNALRKRSWLQRAGLPVLAASGATFALVAMFSIVFFFNAQPQSSTSFETAIGEIRTIELADGSSVKLNTDSKIEVDYTAQSRQIHLVSGEALFDVAHDPDRPFSVFSGKTVAEAIGTSFVVRLRDAVTELAVVEGKVAFSVVAAAIEPRADGGPSPSAAAPEGEASESGIIVGAGQILTSETISNQGTGGETIELPTIESREIQRKLSWTEGLFDFSETPLDEVVAEISRHNPVTIEIMDADLRGLKFGGMFRTGDVDQLLEALEGLGVSVEYVSDDRIVLRKSENT